MERVCATYYRAANLKAQKTLRLVASLLGISLAGQTAFFLFTLGRGKKGLVTLR